MRKLTNKEEYIMKILWKLKTAFIKDIIKEYKEPKPHYNTVSSLVRTLQDKGFIGFKQYGNTYEYSPLISKEDYRKTYIKLIIKDYFDNSYANLVTFFLKEEGLKEEEIEEVFNLIKNK